jgi:pilus assembly protein CpaB
MPGEPVLQSHLRRNRPGGRLAAMLPAGRRAVTVPVAPAGLAGMAPGDRVDVILTAGAAAGRPVVRTIAPAVRVLAIDGRTAPVGADDSASADGHSAVTLETSAGEAQALAVGQEIGKLSLALRTEGERDGPRASPAGLDRELRGLFAALEGASAAAVVAAPATLAPAPAFPAATLPVAAPAHDSRVERVNGVEVVRGSSLRGAAPAPAALEDAPAAPAP